MFEESGSGAGPDPNPQVSPRQALAVLEVALTGLAVAPGEALAALGGAPGPVLAAVTAVFAGPAGRSRLDAPGLVELVAARERLIGWAQAEQLADLVRLERLAGYPPGVIEPPAEPEPVEAAGYTLFEETELAGAEIACRLGISRNAAQARIALALTLARDVPDTLAALRAGAIDFTKARIIVEELITAPHLDGEHALSPVHRAGIEGRVLPEAPRLTPGQLRNLIRRLVLAVDPAAADRRAQAAAADRHIAVAPRLDGMSDLWGVLPAETGTELDLVLDALADGLRDGLRERGGAAIGDAAPGVGRSGLAGDTPTVGGGGRDTDAGGGAGTTHEQRRVDALDLLLKAVLAGQPIPVPIPVSAGSAVGGPDTDAVSPVRALGAALTADLPSPDAVGPPGPAVGAAEASSTDRGGPARSSGWTAWATWTPPGLPRRKGRRPHLVIHAPAATLSGDSGEPGELIGHGPITASHTRALAATAGTVQIVTPPGASVTSQPTARTAAAAGTEAAVIMDTGLSEGDTGVPGVTDACRTTDSKGLRNRVCAPNGNDDPNGNDESGHPGDVKGNAGVSGCRHAGATNGYRPSQAIVDEVTARDRRCRFPGCRRPAHQCDLDHLRPYADGGPTCPCNLIPACRFHHRLRHRGGWTARWATPATPGTGPGHPPGTIEWTSPHGRRYHDPPEP